METPPLAESKQDSGLYDLRSLVRKSELGEEQRESCTIAPHPFLFLAGGAKNNIMGQ